MLHTLSGVNLFVKNPHSHVFSHNKINYFWLFSKFKTCHFDTKFFEKGAMDLMPPNTNSLVSLQQDALGCVLP